MTPAHRIIWSQGMFLQPHHFQQEARYVANAMDARSRAAGLPYAWGFQELVLDEAQLALGRLAITRASGVMRDGTPFSMPDADDLVAPMQLTPDVQGEVIHLAVPMARSGVTEVDFEDQASAPDAASRYRVVEASLRDHCNAGDDPEPVQLGAPRWTLLRERDVTGLHAHMGIARVTDVRADGQVVLDRGYIATQYRIDASGQLSATVRLLHGLVQQRAQALAAQMGQLGHGVSEVADFLMLQLLNRAEPLLAQHAASPSVHPWWLHTTLLQLAGELATFTSASRLATRFAAYDHDDLQASFAPLVLSLRESLSSVMQRHAEQIELVDRKHGVRTALVADEQLLREAGFVLAVRSQLPAEQLRQRFLAQTKLGPAERLRDLVHLQLPGLGLRALPVAPRQLPFHAGSHYFEIDRQGELWQQLQRNGALALHVAGELPGLEIELWALRQS